MKKIIIIAAIFITALSLRLFKLESRPLGFTWDEAALGYNAYSLSQTGKDEFGVTAPLVFKSFGDYKPGLYIYYTVPPVKILGLSEFSTRLPSAVFGGLLVLGILVLATRLFSSFRVGLFAAAAAAANPWLIHFSRGAWEANLALLLAVWGTVLFLRKNLKLAALFFGLTLFSYQGAKLFTPLLVLSLLGIFRSHYSFKKLVVPALILGVMGLPLLIGWSSQAGRLEVFSLFSYTRGKEYISEILRQDRTTSSGLVYRLFHTEALDQARGVVLRYLNHFSPAFLFSSGDWSNPRHAVPFHGYFYLIEVIPFAIGLFLLFSRPKTAGFWLLILWMFIAPLPSAFSRDIVSGVRSLPLAVPLCILVGVGLNYVFSKRVGMVLYSLLFIGSVVYFMDIYIVHYSYYFAKHWLSPYKQAISVVNKNYSQYNRIVFTDTLGQPYIFFLFYNRVDPRQLGSLMEFVPSPVGDVGAVSRLGKIDFMRVDWPAQRGDSSTLFVGNIFELPTQDMNPPNLVNIDELFYPDGSHALRIVGLQ